MIVVGLSHRSTPIAIRERLAVSKTQMPDLLQQLRALDGADEVVVLSTCNRVEVYLATAVEPAQRQRLQHEVASVLGDLGGRDVMPYLSSVHDSEALRHLFRVACSLDSMVVGEPQILGQLKEAIRTASRAGTVGRELHDVMRRALQVAKRVRSKTSIGAGQVSVPSVAVDLARHIFDDLTDHTCVLVGAGDMAESAAKLLARLGAKLVVVNRSRERGGQLADSIGGRLAAWDEMDETLVAADIVVASTASREHVITRKQLRGLRRKRRGRSLFLIDIAVPRDVEPAVNELENVYLYDIDDLSGIVAESLKGRRDEAERAEAMVRKETLQYEQRQQEQRVKPVLVALRSRTREVLHEELGRSCRGRLKHLDEKDRDSLAIMLDAAVNKVLHQPTARLKQLASTSHGQDAAQILSHLFDLDEAIADQRSDQPEIHIDGADAGAVAGTASPAEEADDGDEQDAAEGAGGRPPAMP